MYKKIMVPLDGSELAECVLPHVEEFAAYEHVETIIFVRVTEPVPVLYDESSVYSHPHAYENIREKAEKIEQENKAAAEKYLDGVIERVARDGVTFKGEVLVGEAADKLVDFVEENEIDLIIIATHGRSGISRWVRGSIAERILRSACAPILMIRAEGCVID